MPLFPCKSRSLCIDGPLANLSSELEDVPKSPGRFISLVPPPLDEDWESNGCLGLCVSTISQEDADLCAQRQALLCIWPNVNEPQSCTINCPDGSPFTVTIPAGVFVAATVEEANQIAYAYACQQASVRLICLSPLGECSLCVNESAIVGVLGSNVPVGSSWSISGNTPPGMGIVSENGSSAELQGTPTASGNYIFEITVQTPLGDVMSKTVTIAVLAITTTAITAYQTGVPYSFQLSATGGSGDYAWRIVSGTLPDGLVLDPDGLISGTPTNTTTNAVTFQAVDLGCVDPGKEFFTPRIALTTQSVTTIATILGFAEYAGVGITPSVPPKKYKTLTWTGTSEQWGLTWNFSLPCGRAKYEWSGSSTIDLHGNYLSKYVKLFSADCPNPGGSPPVSNNDWPNFLFASGGFPGSNGIPQVFKGYCWAADPDSCPTCDDTLKPIGDVSPNLALDNSDFLGPGNIGATTITATSIATNGGAAFTMMLDPADVQGFPTANVNGITGPWIRLQATDAYSASLSNEFTDAEALSAALVFSSNSKVAEARPRTTGFVSTWTTVNYTLTFSNLLVGEDYVAEVTLRNDNGSIVTVQYDFQAIETTHTIAAAVPTPADGHTIEVRAATVQYNPVVNP